MKLIVLALAVGVAIGRRSYKWSLEWPFSDEDPFTDNVYEAPLRVVPDDAWSRAVHPSARGGR